MTVTKENVIDMAWKTEGLPELMKGRGDTLAVKLEDLQLEAFLDLGMEENPDPARLEKVYKAMEIMADKYNFDSGRRKYDSI